MRGGFGAAVVAVALLGCSPSPSQAPFTPPSAIDSTGGAKLAVTGSGLLCHQWYAGCAAYLAVVDPGWTLPADWKPAVDDTAFQVDVVAGKESVEVTGVRQAGQARIASGSHRLVVVKTTSPDSGPSIGTIAASILCSLDVEIPGETSAVNVSVAFDASCSIRMSAEGPTPAPGG